MKFRKKPVVIEAFQFDGENLVGPLCRDPGDGQPAYIDTLEGRMVANPGDWIIKGVKGEFYPCKPDIFEKTYEAVSAPPAAINPAVAHVMQYFTYRHLPAHLLDVSRKFSDLADELVNTVPQNQELTVALRKLLEAKDCAVRATLCKPGALKHSETDRHEFRAGHGEGKL